MNSLDNYKAIKLEVDKLNNKHNLIVVTKNKSIETILPIIKNGHLHFGENRVQEAKEKWIPILKNYKDIKLHLMKL
jgi:uncharacterized pyridoxal phosphate-containing UPF0001 family protein